jgi:hypothetical protein
MEVTIRVGLLRDVGLIQPVFVVRKVEFNEYVVFPGMDGGFVVCC